MFECRGCEDITVRRRFYFSEWNPGECETIYYPPRIGRRLPVWVNDLSPEIQSLLKEVYAALQAGSSCLAMMGARAVIDMVILDLVGDAGTFKDKLEKLKDEEYLAPKQIKVLDAALDVGNAASHRGHKPQRKHVVHVMDIVENLLHSTILEPVADELKAATPPRKKKPSNKSGT